MKQLDARGLSCPEPVILIRQAMQSGADAYEMIVDNHAAKENVTRYAEHQGYTVTARQEGGDITLTMRK